MIYLYHFMTIFSGLTFFNFSGLLCLHTKQSNFTPFQFHAELLKSSFLRYSVVYFSFLLYYFWFSWLPSADYSRFPNSFVEKNSAQQFCRLLKKSNQKIVIDEVNHWWMQEYHSLSLTYFLIIISAQVSNSIPIHTLTQGWKSSLLAVLQYYYVSMYPLLIMKIENYSEGVRFCPGIPLRPQPTGR